MIKKENYLQIYNDEVGNYSFVNVLKYILTGKKDKDLLLEDNTVFFYQLMTKQSDWSFEKEWRIMLANLDDGKVYFDLVSKIIIDERVIESAESKKLIELCKEKGWSVWVRKTQYINVAHMFEQLL